MKFVLGLLLLLTAMNAGAQHNLDQAKRDWPDLRLLEPARWRTLPQALRVDLERRGCKLPRFMRWDGEHNVIRGSFLAEGNADIAVLCLAGEDMSIIVYAQGAADNAQEIRKFPADAYRMIHRASRFVLSKRAIRDQVAAQLPVLDHDGIDDGPLGGLTETAYHDNGQWLTPF